MNVMEEICSLMTRKIESWTRRRKVDDEKKTRNVIKQIGLKMMTLNRQSSTQPAIITSFLTLLMSGYRETLETTGAEVNES